MYRISNRIWKKNSLLVIVIYSLQKNIYTRKFLTVTDKLTFLKKLINNKHKTDSFNIRKCPYYHRELKRKRDKVQAINILD
jgi:hypothetical protein